MTGRYSNPITLGAKDFSFLQTVQIGPGAHTVSYSVGHRRSFLAVKWTWRDIDHSPQSRAEIRNKWSHASATPICIRGVVEGQANLYLSLVSYLTKASYPCCEIHAE